MKEKVFIVSKLALFEIRDFIDHNYSTFPIVDLTFDYNEFHSKWRLVVNMKTDRLSLFCVSLRTVWLSSSFFCEEFSKFKCFIDDINEKPF